MLTPIEQTRPDNQHWFASLRNAIGWTGIAFLTSLALLVILYFTPGQVALKVMLFFVLFISGTACAFRLTSYVIRHSLWSLRNRLLFVYALVGVLPIVLIVALVGLAGWMLLSQLAIYMATVELNRSVETIQTAAESIRDMSPEQRRASVPRLADYFRRRFPDLSVHIVDEKGEMDYPDQSGHLAVLPQWSTVHGVLENRNQFFGWAHIVSEDASITVITPLSSDFISNLVPNLGMLSLSEERREDQAPQAIPKSDGITVSIQGNGSKKEFQFTGPTRTTRRSHVPPPANSLDLPVDGFSFLEHMDFDRPGVSHQAGFLVETRPSAVITTLFSQSASIREAFNVAFVVVTSLFVMVEIVAGIIGIRLATRVTGAVNSLYRGTRRVIQGDFGHRIPVRGTDQVGELSHSFNQMTDNLERLLSVEKEKERLLTELEIAREVQSQLYPKQLPPSSGLALTVQCDPARMVSGDYYDYQLLPPDLLAFAIGDVAGKGISAALLMATLQAALRAQMNRYIDDGVNAPAVDVSKLVSTLNKQIYANTAPEKYATFFFGLYDAKSKILTYTNAGHLPPILFRNGAVTQLEINGTVVGAFPFSKYESSQLQLQPGDLLVCYTDGITEPENAYGEMFGEERLIEIVKKQAQYDPLRIIAAVMDAVRRWTGTPELQDDMTLLIARHGGLPGERTGATK